MYTQLHIWAALRGKYSDAHLVGGWTDLRVPFVVKRKIIISYSTLHRLCNYVFNSLVVDCRVFPREICSSFSEGVYIHLFKIWSFSRWDEVTGG